MSAVETAPAAFHPAAFVADLHAAGCRICLCRPVPRGGEKAGLPSYFIGQPFGPAYSAVMERWRDAMASCPDHIGRVVAHLVDLDRGSR